MTKLKLDDRDKPNATTKVQIFSSTSLPSNNMHTIPSAAIDVFVTWTFIVTFMTEPQPAKAYLAHLHSLTSLFNILKLSMLYWYSESIPSFSIYSRHYCSSNVRFLSRELEESFYSDDVSACVRACAVMSEKSEKRQREGRLCLLSSNSQA